MKPALVTITGTREQLEMLRALVCRAGSIDGAGPLRGMGDGQFSQTLRVTTRGVAE